MVTDEAGTTAGIGLIAGAVKTPLSTMTVTLLAVPTLPLLSVARALIVKFPLVGRVQL